MEAPDKIYIPLYPNYNLDGFHLADEWMHNPIKMLVNVEYIRKDALLEWAKELKERWEEPPMSKYSPGCVYMLEQLIDKINSM